MTLRAADAADVDVDPYAAVTGGAQAPLFPHAAPAHGRPSTLAELLVRHGAIATEDVQRARATGRRERVPLAHVLVNEGLISSWDLATLIALHMGVPLVDLRNETIEPQALARLPQPVAARYGVLAFRLSQGPLGEHHLAVAMTDPTDLDVIHDLRVRTGCRIQPVVATADAIAETADIAYRGARFSQPVGQVPSIPSAPGAPAISDRLTASDLRAAPPRQVLDLLLRQAVEDRASDVHIEPAAKHLRVRFRIDGILHDVMLLPLELHPALISRMKIIASLNIAERRKPQDGQFSLDIGDRRVDVRLAVSGTVDGEMAVLRLLAKQFNLLGLDQLGMAPHAADPYRRLLQLPYGIVVVCGPTGAGKSTTLYASILQMDRTAANVISLEDPVEYRIADVNQMQVNADAGVTFATQLRSVLRLDPDVLLVGEVRDKETALIATQAALTGHLVLTSLHANDAVSAVLRLRDLGVPPYLIASSLAGVVAQRMVRVVCKSCGAMQPRPVAERQAYASVTGESPEMFVYGKGCNACAHTGYRGRTGVFEVLTVTEPLRALFMGDAPRSQLSAQATTDGMVPMRSDGMLKVRQGVTTPHEMMRVLFTLD